MKIKSKSSFICLSLLVMRNNNIRKDDVRNGDVKQIIKDICRDIDIELVISMMSLQKCFKHLKGIYIIEEEGIYTAIDDKMFDIIAAAIAPYIMQCLIKYADIAFIANRMQLLSLGRSSLPFAVYIQPDMERNYRKRQYKEATSAKYWEVFGSIQSENQTYRQLFLSFLNEQDTCREITYVPDDHGRTPLFVSSHLGYVYFAEYFIIKCPRHINNKEEQGRSPFYVACQNGHIPKVRYFMKFYYDINAETANKTTALSATCLNGNNETNSLHKTKNGWSVLHVACWMGHTKLVKLLTDVGINVNDTTNNGNTPLCAACENGHYDTVKFLLDLKDQRLNRCVDTTIKDEDEWSVLHVACLKGHTKLVKLLTDVGINVNDTTNNGTTPLCAACENGHYDTVKFLLDLKEQTLNRCVDTTIKDNQGWSVLHIACFMGHTEVIKLFTDFGLNVNDTKNNSTTPLCAACKNGHYDTVKFLLDLNCQALNRCLDTTTTKRNGWSALHTACSNGSVNIVNLLVEIGLSTNARTTYGILPFYLVCENGQYNTVKFLLDLKDQTLNRCVDTTIKDGTGLSVIQVACLKGHTEVVKLLMEVGMNVNDTTNKSYTPLHLACQRGHYDTVNVLLNLNGQSLNSCVDTKMKDKDGWSVLHTACYYGQHKIVKLMIEIGMNVNDTTNTGCSPLYLSCQNGNYDTVKFLLDLNGQTLNSCVYTTRKNERGWSVLHAACSNGNKQVVELLIDVDLNVNVTSNKGFTPLYLACRSGHHDIVKYLLDLKDQTLNSPVDTTTRDENGWSVLHTACNYGRHKIVKLLIDDGVNVNDTTTQGCTPLFRLL
ncbi:ankyrin-1-like [Mytilus edulis]|uniref:ankyrin-1-like n=1 Tax=Mytilus edulis TaxID=6550 RepID=UPI0039F08645